MELHLSRRVLSAFPRRHFVYCFAYGSAVFRQAGRGLDDGSMVDMIFVVDDTPGFHRDNLTRNPGHYSRIRHLGPAAVSAVQTGAGARVYFNTHVTVANGVQCKYGVMDVRDFRRDLREWRTLYMAGRLHKPVLTLFDRGDDGLSSLIQRNLESAVHAALLQLPGRFAEQDLYAAVAGLSYRGDFRMIVGEDRNKVTNIVRPQMDAFRRLYAPALRAVAARGLLSLNADDTQWSEIDKRPLCDRLVEQDVSAGARLHHLRRLPFNMKRAVLLRAGGGGATAYERDGDHVRRRLVKLAERHDLGELVRGAVCRIVFYPSLVQSIKGIPTAGLRNAVVYSYEKLRKMVKSMLL